MAIVTINGLVGSGGYEIGTEVARILGGDYVDRLILAEAARRIGATVEAVADKVDRPRTRGERVASFIQTLLERSAAAGAGGDPYFGPGIEALMGRDYYPAEPQGPITRAQEIADSRLIEVTTAVIQELARQGNVVITGRGANIILKDTPGAFHVGLVAPWNHRVELIMRRENLDRKAAEKFTADTDKARIAYFRKFFKVHPDDPLNYHMALNTGTMDISQASNVIARTAAEFAK